ncbi:tumor necrosis factor receptor superfamily member 5-like [Haliotis rubra]|uniref:tumor necrosis factor receptor superfamily member 5-like n=1 Tax=Haliotis rubra TaxID=36100 RepID=UPI001EE50C55|nr:tumor necrosis factor receptor superfamily member 5-like [Haliotis rubra]XP_046564755.1 tumor necrosis factor receptor superfamily member 5-like [Haliotis rubra]
MTLTYLRTGMSLLAALCVMMTLSTTSEAAIMRDNPNLGTYTHNRLTCFKCQPGTYLDRHCTEDFTYSLCNPCPVDTFQSHYSQATRCSPCHTFCLHDNNMEVVQNCTSIQDLKCQCKQGYYLHVADVFSDTKTCKKHSSCTQGKVIIKSGTSTSDIECGYCPDGQFSKDGQCWTCSSCIGENTTLVTPCNATSDATCQHHPTNDSSDLVTEITEIPTHKKDGNVNVAVVAVPVVLMFLVVAAFLVVCYVVRQKGVKDIYSIELNERRISAPLIDRSDSTCSTQPLKKKQRTFSDSSAVSARPVSSFPDLNDPDMWTRPVFDLLCRRLTDWKRFMRHLPGDADYTACVNSRCEQIEKEEQGIVMEQIHKALQEWSQGNTDEYVKVDSILDTIEQVFEQDGKLYKDIWDLCCDLAKKQKQRNIPNDIV